MTYSHPADVTNQLSFSYTKWAIALPFLLQCNYLQKHKHRASAVREQGRVYSKRGGVDICWCAADEVWARITVHLEIWVDGECSSTENVYSTRSEILCFSHSNVWIRWLEWKKYSVLVFKCTELDKEMVGKKTKESHKGSKRWTHNNS